VKTDTVSNRGYFVAAAAVLVIVLLVVATFLLRPGAPRHVVIATGSATSTFFRYGQAYQAILKRSGVTLEVKPVEGSTAENVKQLEQRHGDVQVAIVHGGTLETETDGGQDAEGIEQRHPDLVTLGTVFIEPLWIFHRLPGTPDTLDVLAGKRVAIGRKGSVSNNLARLVLKTGGIDASAVTLLETRGADAAKGLASGEIDAAILSAPIDARAIQDLWRTPGVKLMSLGQVEAYTRHLPWMKEVTLPAGGLDIGGNAPPSDVKMLASGASLVVRETLHPGIVYLLLSAATRVHGGANAFQRYGEFPSLSYVDLPVHDAARRYYKEGPSGLYRYLPFWLASILDRIGVVLPVVIFVLSISRYAPPLYRWLVQNRINRFYGELRYLEDELDRARAETDVEALVRRLDAIEAGVARLSAPVSYAERLYTLRSHVQMVRDRGVGRGRS
jgi:TRAP transporter TAXI family solute receptor